MSIAAEAVDQLAGTIGRRSSRIGRRIEINREEVLDRSGDLPLQPPGRSSPNGACRLLRTRDGWIAVNFARAEDRRATPAWVGCDLEADPWHAVEQAAKVTTADELVAGARLLGIPAARLAEVEACSLDAPLKIVAAGGRARGERPLKVVDLSSLWAGPLCGSILAEIGASVTKVESLRRPDGARAGAPKLFQRLNGKKARLTLDFHNAADLDLLRQRLKDADIVITSVRRRALDQLGLSPEAAFEANPGLIWVAVTGYGFDGAGRDHVAFGDDAAVAGGLVRLTPHGAPRFAGDALADPLTGLAAAAGALSAVGRGGGVIVDAALARTAAGAASLYRRAAA